MEFQLQRVSRGPLRVVLGATIGLALVAMPAVTASAEDVKPEGKSTFIQKIATEIVIGEDVQPKSIAVSPDGGTAYVTTREGGLLSIVDLTTNAVKDTVEIDSPGGVHLEMTQDGSFVYFAQFKNHWSNENISALNTITMELTEFKSTVSKPQSIALNVDETGLFILGLDGKIALVDLDSGELLESTKLKGVNYNTIALGADGNELLVGGKEGLFALNPDSLELKRTMQVSGVDRISSMMIDENPNRLYVAGSGRLSVVNPADGDVLESAVIGSGLSDVIGDDATKRAYTSVTAWDKVMAGNFNTGERSESFRWYPKAANGERIKVFDLARNPVSGDLLTANAGWINADQPHGASISIIHAPLVSDPMDQTATEAGEEILFTSSVVGIKPGNGGGVQWELSEDDGGTWANVEGATGDELTLIANGPAIGTQVRLRWSDDFWGESGVTEPAILLANGPEITREEALPDGEVGEGYPETLVAATGLDGMVWSTTQAARAIAGLPAGLALHPETGVITGVPETAGDYVVTVSVTDDFGEDTKDFPLTVLADPAPAPDPTPTPDPSAPAPDPTPTPGSGQAAKPNTPAGEDSDLAATGVGPLIPAMLTALVLILGGGAAIWTLSRRGTRN